jgi:ATP-dependent HslUV protease ATP-binding subunit HslU
MKLPLEDLTPQQIVAELDRYIIGQSAAKRAVAVALRNRYRRQQLPRQDRSDITPKNILMIGPTGVGKTEIARRLAQLARAPFIKVEATKFTEVGYVGRDVESMVRELAAVAVRLVEQEKVEEFRHIATEQAIDEIVEALDQKLNPQQEFEYRRVVDGDGFESTELVNEGPSDEEIEARRAALREEVIAGRHDQELIEIMVEEEAGNKFLQVFTPGGMEEMGLDMSSLLGGGSRTQHVSRRVSVSDAREILSEAAAMGQIDQSAIMKEAIYRTEQSGVIFLDEIDKIAMKGGGSGPEVSREGVQRDLLPIIEGSVVPSKFGPIRTDHILFIAAGAFHESKPSDLIPELQGRLPIRVELEPLTEDDFRRILSEPKNALTHQYAKLLSVEGVTLTFDSHALDELAHLAAEANLKAGNTGARRLQTLMERLLEDVMFDAGESAQGEYRVDVAMVRERLATLVKDAKVNRTLI